MKKIKKILSLTVVVASMMTPLILMANNSNGVSVEQETDGVDNDSTIESDNINNDIVNNQAIDVNNAIDDGNPIFGDFPVFGQYIDSQKYIDSDKCTALYTKETTSTWMGIKNPEEIVFIVTKDHAASHYGEVKIWIGNRGLHTGDLKIPAWIMVHAIGVTYHRFNVIAIEGPGMDIEDGCHINGTITIPNSITDISENAFINCLIGKIEIDIMNPKYALASAKSVGDAKIVIDKTIYPNLNYYDYTSKPIGHLACGKITIPEDIVSIKNDLFEGCFSINSFVLKPSTKLETIGNNAFSNCIGLTSLDLSNATKLTTISDSAFNGCSSLTGPLTIPASVTSIGIKAFANGPHFTKINIAPENIKYGLADNVGADCYMILDKTIGLSFNETTTNIGCLVCGEFIIPQTVSFIKNSIFQGCTGITTLTIPTNVTSIGSNAFSDCSNLVILDLLSAFNLQSINNDAFKNCFRLGNFSLLNAINLTSLSGFANCSSLTNLNFCEAQSLEEIGPSAFNECTNLIGTLTFPASVSTIGNFAFQGCTRLTGLNIPLTVTTIGERAFSDCTGLTGPLTVPPTLTTIGYYAFYNVGSQEFRFLAETPPSLLPPIIGSKGKGIFGENIKKTLWVPNAQAKVAYDSLAIDSFGLASPSYIEYHSTAPIAVDIIYLKKSYNIYSSEANKTIATAVADFKPFDALADVDWFLKDAPPWLKIDANGNIYANDELKNVVLGEYHFKVEVISKIDSNISNITDYILLNLIHAPILWLGIESITPVNVTLGAQATTLTTCKAAVFPENADPTKVEWSIPWDKPDWLDINSTTGVISTNSSVVDKNLPAFANYDILAKSTDGSNLTANKTLTINFIRPEATGITILNLNTIDGYTAKVGINFETRLDWEMVPDYAKKTEVIWELTGPEGMKIDENGEITYLPTKIIPEANFTVKCTSKNPAAGSTQLTSKIKVTPADVKSITINNIGTFNLELGENKESLVTCSAIVHPNPESEQGVTWLIDNKPSWIDINQNSGVISINNATDVALLESGEQIVKVKATSIQDPTISETKNFSIHFSQPKPTNIEIDGLGDYIVENNKQFSKKLSVKVYPEYASPEFILSLKNAPAGMIIDSTGTIKYLPTSVASKFDFKVVAKSNGAWATFTKEFDASIIVVKNDQFPTWAIALLTVVGGGIVIGAATATGIVIHKRK